MTIKPILGLEKRLFLFSLPGFAIATLIVALGFFAVINGQISVKRTTEAQTEFMTSEIQAMEEWRNDLVEIDRNGQAVSPYKARPMNIRIPVILPPAPLADFANGVNDLHPTTAVLTAWSNPVDLFTEYEVSNPSLSRLGGFDFTFLVVILLPLIMIAASFEVLAGDRERGRARLVAVQAGHIGPSIWKRLVVRNVSIWACFAVVASVAALSVPFDNNSLSRITYFGTWLAIATIYSFFWFGLIIFSVSLIKRSETVAASLFTSWVLFAFAIPAIGGAVAEASYPPPSRLVFLSEMREGEVDAIRETAELTAGFLADHPELTVSDDGVPGYYRSNLLTNQEITKRTEPILNAFNHSRDQRASLISKLQYLSPAMIANNALTTISGADVDRHLAFQKQMRAALLDLSERIGPAVVAKQRLSLNEYDALPEYEFQDSSLLQKTSSLILPIGFLTTLSILLIVLARRQLSRPLEALI